MYIYIQSLLSQWQYNMQHVQGRQVKYMLAELCRNTVHCWTDRSNGGGSGNGISDLFPQRKPLYGIFGYRLKERPHQMYLILL